MSVSSGNTDGCQQGVRKIFEKIACACAEYAGSPYAIGVSAVALFLLWWFAGLDVANLAISIVSLVLLFLLQGSSNRDTAALHAKLDAIIKASDAPNEMMGLDRQTKEEIESARDA
jgi:low affinity Fe/Cu permease